MALTLAEAAKYSNDILQTGVIELLVYDDPILQRLPFKDILGNGLTYNVETTMSGAAFYAVNAAWTESTSVVTSATAKTTILGGDADVDNFLKATRSNLQDLMGEQIAAKTKAIKKAFMEVFYYGYQTGGGADANKFDGLHYLIRNVTAGQQNAIGVNNATANTPQPGSIKEIEETIDCIKGRKADLLVMTKQTRRNINEYLNGVGGITKEAVAGKTVQTILETPVAISDYISNDESCDDTANYYGAVYGHDFTDGTALGNDDNSTTIFCLSFGPEACCGVQSQPITVVKLGDLETKDAVRVRIKWYPSIMIQSTITCAKYSGISNAVFTVS